MYLIISIKTDLIFKAIFFTCIKLTHSNKKLHFNIIYLVIGSCLNINVIKSTHGY